MSSSVGLGFLSLEHSTQALFLLYYQGASMTDASQFFTFYLRHYEFLVINIPGIAVIVVIRPEHLTHDSQAPGNE